jgi:hypothetical protein
LSTKEHPDVISAGPRTEFQVRLRVLPDENDDEQLKEVAEIAIEALAAEAASLALGPVASIDLDRREIWLEMTVEAASGSEAHQKMGLILGALERGAAFVIRESNTWRSVAPDDQLVCA